VIAKGSAGIHNLAIEEWVEIGYSEFIWSVYDRARDHNDKIT
jgi:hypothetical protein